MIPIRLQPAAQVPSFKSASTSYSPTPDWRPPSSDGSRKVKQNAVKLDGELKNDLVASVKLGSEFTLRAGKKMVRVAVEA